MHLCLCIIFASLVMKCRGIASSLPFSSPLVYLKRNPREFNSVSVEMHFCSKQSNLHSVKSKCFNFWWNAIVRLLITAAGAWEWECTRVTREIVGFQSGFVYHHTTSTTSAVCHLSKLLLVEIKKTFSISTR